MDPVNGLVPIVSRPPSLPFGSGGGSAAGSGAGVSSIFPPHLFPPLGAQIVFKQGRGDVTGIAPIVTPAALDFVVPVGRIFVLANAQPMILAPLDASDVVWRILVNGYPVPGFDALSIQMRAAASLSETFSPIGAMVQEEQRVSVQIEARDGQAYTVAMQYYGWHFGKNDVAGL